MYSRFAKLGVVPHVHFFSLGQMINCRLAPLRIYRCANIYIYTSQLRSVSNPILFYSLYENVGVLKVFTMGKLVSNEDDLTMSSKYSNEVPPCKGRSTNLDGNRYLHKLACVYLLISRILNKHDQIHEYGCQSTNTTTVPHVYKDITNPCQKES